MLTIDIFCFFLAEELGNVGANGPCSIRRQAMLVFRFSLALGGFLLRLAMGRRKASVATGGGGRGRNGTAQRTIPTLAAASPAGPLA